MARSFSLSSCVARDATTADADDVARVYLASGLAAWGWYLGDSFDATSSPPAEWREKIEAISPPAAFLVGADDEGIGGFVWLRPSEDDDAGPRTGEVQSFYTHPRVWGRGVGRELLDLAERLLGAAGFTEATLWTEERNSRALAVYAKAGWFLDGTTRERDYDGVPARELRHRKALNSGRVDPCSS